MAELSELPFSVRAFLKACRWRRIDPVPWSALARPLAECRLALVSSAGFVLREQEPFDDAVRGGDLARLRIDYVLARHLQGSRGEIRAGY